MSAPRSMAGGAEFDQVTWDDFVERLRHHRRGEGVRHHCTADAIFLVQARKLIFGIDLQYTDKRVVIHEDRHWLDPKAYWDDLDADEQAKLDAEAMETYERGFLGLQAYEQWGILEDLDGHTVTGWDETWEYVCSHFTREAADAFIRRKAHDYREGLRVYVDAQLHCWEYNAVVDAIIDGRLMLVPPKDQS